MSGKLFLKAKNEETLLPRVLRVLSKQGVDVQELNMKVQSDGMELEIVLNTESDVAQMAKLLAKQVAVVSVNTQSSSSNVKNLLPKLPSNIPRRPRSKSTSFGAKLFNSLST